MVYLSFRIGFDWLSQTATPGTVQEIGIGQLGDLVDYFDRKTLLPQVMYTAAAVYLPQAAAVMGFAVGQQVHGCFRAFTQKNEARSSVDNAGMSGCRIITPKTRLSERGSSRSSSQKRVRQITSSRDAPENSL
jgi:hypothetical protein